MVSAASFRLADYRPWPFVLSTIRMDVDIRAEDVVVSSRLELTPQEGADTLELWGVDLEICASGWMARNLPTLLTATSIRGSASPRYRSSPLFWKPAAASIPTTTAHLKGFMPVVVC